MNEIIYIAGKITGDPDYKEKFAAVQEYYEGQGYTVLNPAMLPGNLPNSCYARIDLAMIDCADIVVFVSDYDENSFAETEHRYCEYSGKLHDHLSGTRLEFLYAYLKAKKDLVQAAMPSLKEAFDSANKAKANFMMLKKEE